MKIDLSINGRAVQTEVPAFRTLIDFLRGKGLWSMKHGCDTGQCGSCTVILEGKAVHSCSLLAIQVAGKSLATYENVRSDDRYSTLKEALMALVDIDCGYCIPGTMMSLVALINHCPVPTEEQVRDAIAGNNCHCISSEQGLVSISNIMEAIDKIGGKW